MITKIDEYSNNHDAMKLLSDLVLAGIPDNEGNNIVRSAICYLREQAYDFIGYGATTPNKGWDGKRV